METKKISKWDAAPKSIKNVQELVNALYDPLPDEQNPIIDALSKVLDDYNKLEAKHQLDCGLISDYAEENARLKQKNEKASNNIRDLRRVLEENDIAIYVRPVTGSWEVVNTALQRKTEHFNKQLDNLRERLKEDEKSKEKWIARYHNMSEICSRDEDDSEMLQAILRKDGYTIEYDGDIDDETIRCQDPLNICKETTQDEVTYQYGRWTLRRPQNFSEAKANADVAILKKQIRDRDKEIAKLKNKFDTALDDAVVLNEEKIMLASKNKALGMELCERNKQIHELKQKVSTYEKEDDGWFHGSYVEKLKKELAELKEEKETLENQILNILETMEAKAGLTRIHLLDSYEDRANLIMAEYEKLKKENQGLKDRISNHDYSLCRICGWKASSKRKDKIIAELEAENDNLITNKKRLNEVNIALRRTVRILDEGGYF